MAPIYGSKALVLDYPNLVDRMEGKDGYGIWFHGLNKPLKPTDTKGCVAVENGNIDALASLVTLGDTPVIISEKIEMVAPSELEKQKKELLGVIETWKNAWQNEDIDKYMSVYSKHFKSSGKNWHEWKEYKARLARQYKKIKVEVLNLRILANDGVAMATFTQKYGNGRFDSMGKKTLFLRQNSREWKIIGEEFQGSGIQRLKGRTEPVVAKKEPSTHAVAAPPEPEEAELTGMSDMAEIQGFLGRWEKAWEKKDFGVYMACYDSGFHSGKMDFRAWKAHKEKLNRKYRSISVDIQDLKVEQPSPFVAKASFRQKYKADDYRDEGLKNLLLIKKGKHWKIKEEEWQPLDPGSRP